MVRAEFQIRARASAVHFLRTACGNHTADMSVRFGRLPEADRAIAAARSGVRLHNVARQAAAEAATGWTEAAAAVRRNLHRLVWAAPARRASVTASHPDDWVWS